MIEDKIKRGTEEYRLANERLELIIFNLDVYENSFLKKGNEEDAMFFKAYAGNFNLIASCLDEFPKVLIDYFKERKKIVNQYLQEEITLKEARKYWEKGLF